MDTSLIEPTPGEPSLAARDALPQRGPPPLPGAAARIEVLLSTYNGATYLPELLDSIVAQRHTNVHLRVRDDGSTDATLQILDEYARTHSATVVRGPNLGVPASYFQLLQAADPNADFYAFCDQDDVWFPHKLGAAAEVLARGDHDVPALYCSALVPVDQALAPLPIRWVPPLEMGFRNALVENRASGCTTLFNRAAYRLLTRCVPRAAQMHDHWAYLVVSAFGTIHYDPRPSLLYRQHPRNRVGIPLWRWLWRILRLRERRRAPSPMYLQAAEFRDHFRDLLEPAALAVLDRFLAAREGGLRRVGYALRPETFRQSIRDDLAHRVLIGLGLF